jgi:uncharacterized protein (UPF0332 family)
MTKKTKQQLILNKGTEKFIFRYDRGSEDKLLDALIEQAKNRRTSFDWFDAAVLSFKLAQSLINQADGLLRRDKHILNSNSQTQWPAEKN